MSAVAALLSLCIGALTQCPVHTSPGCVAQVASGFSNVMTIITSPDDTLAAVATYDGLHVYTVSTGDSLHVPHSNGLVDAAFSPDGALIAVSDYFDGVGVVSLGTASYLWFDISHEQGASLAFSPDGSRIAFVKYSSGAIDIRDAVTGTVVSTITGSKGGVGALYYTPDGSRIIHGCAGNGGDVHVWDVATGMSLRVITHTSNVLAVAVSPDGLYLATATSSKAIVIYSLIDYSTLHTISSGGDVSSLSFARDGSSLAAVGAFFKINIYSVASGSTRISYTPDSLEMGEVVFMHNSNRFLTASNGPHASHLLLWDAPPVPVQLVTPSGTQDVAGVPVAGPEVVLTVGGMALSAVPASLQGASSAHGTRVAVGEKLQLSCASGTCGFVVAVYSCKPCADAANDFEAQMVVEGFAPWICAPLFSVAGGSGSWHHVMRAFHTSVVSGEPVVLEAVVHATEYVVVFPVDGDMGVSCPAKVFTGPSPPCRCVTP
eukprot:TRINITY_DN11603_c1_g1_i1.p1 TRINITY_DN11603_c1_g1~~TRINITY_DN11603_c1_g1_i1.p1  ORF type:complete len:489 (+),score=74.46 TRINITY_DN11603_c1_g1_i1:47-1513(+)